MSQETTNNLPMSMGGSARDRALKELTEKGMKETEEILAKEKILSRLQKLPLVELQKIEASLKNGGGE